MREQNPFKHGSSPCGSLWRSCAGMTLIAFAAVAALLLVYEHRVHLFTENELLVVLVALCVGMHFFMHGGHGGENRNSDEGDRP